MAQSSVQQQSAAASSAGGVEPLLIRAAKRQPTPRAPCWMMRQAGRYMKAYQELSQKHPSFRERSEVPDLIVETTLQPWRAFKPDGVILFSDILTPLPAMGIDFTIDDVKGPILENTLRTKDGLKTLRTLDESYLGFVSESLTRIRAELEAAPGPEGPAGLLGFVGCPWTLATYVVEGKSSAHYLEIKKMTHTDPETLAALLKHLSEQIAKYICLQIEAGAQAIQLFDSWGGQLPPKQWDYWSKPYIQYMIDYTRQRHPDVPLTLYINGSGGLLERIKSTGVDVVGVDWQVDMADARQRLGQDVALQGNIDPALLYCSKEAITDGVRQCLIDAGKQSHILNLGHGVLRTTPEDNVAHFFDTVKQLSYDKL